MIKPEERSILHQYIILDMAIRSLQQDYSSLEKLKMSKIYIAIVDDLLKTIRNDFYNKKRWLAQKGISVVKWVKTDDFFSEVTIKTTGEDVVLQYANQAIKTQVEKLIFKHIGSD
ncbi:aconitate hydratase [Lysinibacillus sp. Ag94]|uniref:aconitate hydratase n=1 Tax=Lysinibacillus sp. Ag94 TaxID=2936682 RepID=UPI00200CC5AC|nr:aconitate hydratase [Lysinibacillus sp. Ag94]UPW82302.1 aconitate hydratase [Lysinibacillus sp. Ag94]